ncbi:sulfate adenylyltransferase subunit CysD [Mucisphaera sp.]|uniref:sulfate adenylyltransferase subunit CysD n=1 Tax=Mucisphaera sp. TaxID=2913024 RepID=UPI003D117E59
MTDTATPTSQHLDAYRLTHLRTLEAESIHIIREVVAEFDKPVMLFSIGKDSCVMLHLARKAFAPGKPPFPLLQIDTGWNFQSMYDFRDNYIAGELGLEVLVHINEEGAKQGLSPFIHGSKTFTDVMNLGALRQALDKYDFDAAFGGGRRDEEKARAKERVYSFRDENHRWDPKNQRPELWNIYNGAVHKGEQIRAFPLSNWTELDIWQYIHLENIQLVPIYFASEMDVVEFEGQLIGVDDDRVPEDLLKQKRKEWVRFRTLGDYPLSGATPSKAETLPQIIQEMLLATRSEREGRVIDKDPGASMEEKKRQGYY